MAAPNPVSLDTLITIKVLTDGENRRFKLPLKDLGPHSLPQKLTNLLAVPNDKTVVFERYSDSAGTYVKLDSDNVSVFKQLHRAAKAKLKLRIRATILDAEVQHMPAAKPAQDMAAGTGLADSTPSFQAPKNTEPASSHLPLELAQAQMNAIKASLDAQHRYQLEQIKNLSLQQTPSQPKSASESLAHDYALPPQYYEPPKYTPGDMGRHGHQDYTMQLMLLEQQNKKRLLMARQEQDSLRPHSKDQTEQEGPFGGPGAQFTVCCNNCHADIPGAHWHCSICVEGDYDLCQDCVEAGQHCYVDYHFLIKRIIENGRVINSTIEKATKRLPKVENPVDRQAEPDHVEQAVKSEDVEIPGAFTEPIEHAGELTRTCNACVNAFDESNFVTCLNCEDYDLCMACHTSNAHGHHPAHAFAPVASRVEEMASKAKALCAPGRDVHHQAICDGCNKSIVGIRHKCLACPDFDYCQICAESAHTIHPGHRFAPIYDALTGPVQSRAIHFGIRCDGPLCNTRSHRSFIVGDRYKCAVCHDTDFCANCEALPTHPHNRTHPLIKFRSPVRSCSVTTIDEKAGGSPVALGDQIPQTESRSTETTPAAPSANAATQVQTVAEVKPVEVQDVKPAPEKQQPARSPSPIKYQAAFVRDTVPDGTTMEVNTVFEQVWTLRNPGPHDWPAGTNLRFTGGDRMLDIDSTNPASISELEKALTSKPIDRVVKRGEEVSVAMTLRAPSRYGVYISYWRLKTPEGTPFGHRLWCDIHVEPASSSPVAPKVDEPEQAPTPVQAPTEELRESQMIFPTLEKESPASSLHDGSSGAPLISPEDQDFLDDVESLGFADETTDDGFLTDEEYEILDNDSENGAASNGKA